VTESNHGMAQEELMREDDGNGAHESGNRFSGKLPGLA